MFETNKKIFLSSIENVCGNYFLKKVRYLQQKKKFIKASEDNLITNNDLEILFIELKKSVNSMMKSQRKFKIMMK